MDSLTYALSCDAYPRQGQNPVAGIALTKDIVLVHSVWESPDERGGFDEQIRAEVGPVEMSQEAIIGSSMVDKKIDDL